MSQKLFFSLSALVLLAMIAFFSFQLSSLPETGCVPDWNFDCDVEAQVQCMGGYEKILYYSACVGNETCVGDWGIWCFGEDETEKKRSDNIDCEDAYNPGCAEN